MRRDLTALAVAAVLCGAAGAARAQQRVGILDVGVTGVPRDGRERFEASFVEGLTGAGFTVVPRAKVADALVAADAPEGCTFGPCLAGVGEALGLDLVLVARVTASGPSYTFVLTLVDTATGIPVRQVTDGCAVCTVDEALAQSTMAVVSLATGAGEQSKTIPPREPPPREPPRARGAFRTALLVGEGLGLAAIVAGVLLVRADEDAAGWAAIGAGGGLAVASFTFYFAAP